MLTKAGLAILDVLSSGHPETIKELASETGYSRKQVYRVVDDLRDAGLLHESRSHHNQRVVRATDHPVVGAYQHLIMNLGHVDWESLLSPATIQSCWYLNQPRRISTIAKRLGITRQAVHKAISPLKNRAMLNPAGPEYALADDLHPLLEFTHTVVTHEHRKRIRKTAPSATIAWCDPKRALSQVTDNEDTTTLQATSDWTVTGLARFQEYGLQFFLAGEPAFWYAPDELTPEEVICHTLSLTTDARRVSYSMLLIEQEGITQNNLMEIAAWYGLESIVEQMYRLIKGDRDATEEMRRPMPSDQEYAVLKNQYGVS